MGEPLLWFERGGISSPYHPHSADTPPTASLPVSSPGRESGSWQDQGTWWLSCGRFWTLHWPMGAFCFSWGDSFALGQNMLFHKQLMLRQGSGAIKIASGPPGSGSFPEQPLLGVITLSKAWGLAQGPVFSRTQVEFPVALPADPPNLTQLCASSSVTSYFDGGGIVTSQSCASFCCTVTRISRTYTCTPSLLDFPPI